MISANTIYTIVYYHNKIPCNIRHRGKIYLLNNMRANNRGKIKKKRQCFIYNPTPDYKSNNNYLQKIKAHGFIP